MKNLKLFLALLVLVCANVALSEDAPPKSSYIPCSIPCSTTGYATCPKVMAGEISEFSAFATWADEKEAPVPQRKLASYDTIDKACRNLAATIQIRADLVNKPQEAAAKELSALIADSID